MITKWLAYYARIKDRVHIDHKFFSDANVVVKLYIHFKWGAGKRRFNPSEPRPSIAFFPQPAGPWYNIWLVLQNTRLRIVKNLEASDYIFIFDDATHSESTALLPQSAQATLINHSVTDISKSHVSRVFKDVFGYEIQIDPTTYQGPAVEKSDENGTHDGRLVTCPIPKKDVRPECCYQKLIDSSFNGKTCEDLRVAYVFGEAAAVFHKHKAFERRFGTDYLDTTVHTAEDCFSETELASIRTFCEAIGLDFGAIDVMRDKHDSRIYIVDVNKTCMPVLSLPYPEQYRSLAMIADVFERRLPNQGNSID